MAPRPTRGDGDEALANVAAALPLQVVGVGALTGPPDRSVLDVRVSAGGLRRRRRGGGSGVEQSALPVGASSPLIVTLRDDQGVVAADTTAASATGVPWCRCN